jgi:hypothetical protein
MKKNFKNLTTSLVFGSMCFLAGLNPARADAPSGTTYALSTQCYYVQPFNGSCGDVDCELNACKAAAALFNNASNATTGVTIKATCIINPDFCPNIYNPSLDRYGLEGTVTISK